MKAFRSSPFLSPAFALHAFIFSCCGVSFSSAARPIEPVPTRSANAARNARRSLIGPPVHRESVSAGSLLPISRQKELSPEWIAKFRRYVHTRGHGALAGTSGRGAAQADGRPRRAGRAGRRRGPGRLPRAGGRPLARVLPAPDGPGGAHPLSARPLPHPREAAAGGG